MQLCSARRACKKFCVSEFPSMDWLVICGHAVSEFDGEMDQSAEPIGDLDGPVAADFFDAGVEQLAMLQIRPDDSVALNTKIERLSESVAASTRYAG